MTVLGHGLHYRYSSMMLELPLLVGPPAPFCVCSFLSRISARSSGGRSVLPPRQPLGVQLLVGSRDSRVARLKVSL